MLTDIGDLSSIKIDVSARMSKPIAKSPNQIKIVLCNWTDQLHGVGKYDLGRKSA